jgi:hypothetical protein
LVLVGVGAGVYFFRDSLPFASSTTEVIDQIMPVRSGLQETTSSANSKNDRKIINLPEYGVFMSYPNTYVFLSGDDQYNFYLFRGEARKNEFVKCMNAEEGRECNLYDMAITVVTQPKVNNDFATSVDSEENFGGDPNFTFKNLESRKLGGYPAYVGSYPGMGLIGDAYIDIGKDKIIKISGNFFDEEEVNYQEFLKIVDTIKKTN